MLSSETVERHVTDECIGDIVEEAILDDTTFWKIRPSAKEIKEMPEGKHFIFVEGSDDRIDGGERVVTYVYYLSVQEIRQAYIDMLDLDQGFVDSEIHNCVIDSWRNRAMDELGEIDTSSLEGEACDRIIQVACFGDVQY